MRLPELAVLYVLIGVGSAAGFLAVKRPLTAGALVDAALLGSFWPLYGPFLVLQGRTEPGRTTSRAVASGHIASPELPLSSLLPDPATAASLEQRLTLAQARVADIDHLLSLPEFSDVAAKTRHQELERRGDHRAAATARQRVQSIGRLKQLRERFATELIEIREILAQFRIQAEVVRLAGEDDGQSTRELISELQLRMETLDEMLGEESPVLAPVAQALP